MKNVTILSTNSIIKNSPDTTLSKSPVSLINSNGTIEDSDFSHNFALKGGVVNFECSNFEDRECKLLI